MSNIEYSMSNYEVKGLNIESAGRRAGSGLDKMKRIELEWFDSFDYAQDRSAHHQVRQAHYKPERSRRIVSEKLLLAKRQLWGRLLGRSK